MALRTYHYFVYILSSERNIFYVGVTNNLERRMYEHKSELIDGFSKKYHIHRLVYFEETDQVDVAILREKQLKKWSRKKKIALIKSINPDCIDLSAEWFDI